MRASCSLGFKEADVSQAETASSEREPSTELGKVIRRDERERQVSSTVHFSSEMYSEVCKVGLDGEEPMVGNKSRTRWGHTIILLPTYLVKNS